MIQYGRNETLKQELDGIKQTYDVANLISVAGQLNTSMNDEQFAVVPKSGGLWRTHVFGNSPIVAPYHNVPIQHQDCQEGCLDLDVSPECLLVRLALTLFAYNGNFFTARRNTMIYNPNTCESESKILSPSELKKHKKFNRHGPGSSTVSGSTPASVNEGLEQMEEMESFDRIEQWLGFEEGLGERCSSDILPTVDPKMSGREEGPSPTTEEGAFPETSKKIVAVQSSYSSPPNASSGSNSISDSSNIGKVSGHSSAEEGSIVNSHMFKDYGLKCHQGRKARVEIVGDLSQIEETDVEIR